MRMHERARPKPVVLAGRPSAACAPADKSDPTPPAKPTRSQSRRVKPWRRSVGVPVIHSMATSFLKCGGSTPLVDILQCGGSTIILGNHLRMPEESFLARPWLPELTIVAP